MKGNSFEEKKSRQTISKCLDRREIFSCMWSLNMFYLLDTLAEKANGGRVTPRRGRKLGKMIWNQRGEENRQDDGRGRSQDGSWTPAMDSRSVRRLQSRVLQESGTDNTAGEIVWQETSLPTGINTVKKRHIKPSQYSVTMISTQGTKQTIINC